MTTFIELLKKHIFDMKRGSFYLKIVHIQFKIYLY